MTARVSVIVPCHDHGHLLGEALDSIAAQGVAGVEVIVVDDRSTDATAAVAAQHGVRVIPSPGPGAGAARNAGVAASAGELIAFLDADDVWPPASLEVRLAALAGADGAYGAVEEFVQAGHDGPEPRTAGATRLPGTIVVTRDAWNRVGPINETVALGEFIDWVARFDEAGLSAVAVPDVVLRRRIHDSNTTRTAGADANASYLDIARLHRRRRQP